MAAPRKRPRKRGAAKPSKPKKAPRKKPAPKKAPKKAPRKKPAPKKAPKKAPRIRRAWRSEEIDLAVALEVARAWAKWLGPSKLVRPVYSYDRAVRARDRVERAAGVTAYAGTARASGKDKPTRITARAGRRASALARAREATPEWRGRGAARVEAALDPVVVVEEALYDAADPARPPLQRRKIAIRALATDSDDGHEQWISLTPLTESYDEAIIQARSTLRQAGSDGRYARAELLHEISVYARR